MNTMTKQDKIVTEAMIEAVARAIESKCSNFPDFKLMARAAIAAMSTAQEPALDDDAVIGRLQLAESTLGAALGSALGSRATIHITRAKQIRSAVTEAIARLQAKAPETDYCGIVVVPETGESDQ